MMYVGRDAAHKRLIEALAAGKPRPVDLKGKIIYFMRPPSPAKPGRNHRIRRPAIQLPDGPLLSQADRRGAQAQAA